MLEMQRPLHLSLRRRCLVEEGPPAPLTLLSEVWTTEEKLTTSNGLGSSSLGEPQATLPPPTLDQMWRCPKTMMGGLNFSGWVYSTLLISKKCVYLLDE